MRLQLNLTELSKEALSIEFLDYLLYLALKSSKDKLPQSRSIVVAGIFSPRSRYKQSPLWCFRLPLGRHPTYQKMGLVATVTNNPQISQVCQELSSYFTPQKDT